MLTISRRLVDSIVRHALCGYPHEMCGVIAGPARSDCPTRFRPMVNVEYSPHWFAFGVDEQLAVWREMDDRGEDPIVIYHSHPTTEAYPSPTDVEMLTDREVHYLIIAVDREQVRSYRAVDGGMIEEPITIVADLPGV